MRGFATSGLRRRWWVALCAMMMLIGSFSMSTGVSRAGEKDATDNAPLKNFDFVWKTFQRRYAFFGLRGVDWQKSRRQFRSQLTKHSSQKKLYFVLRNMTDQLRDAHVTWSVPDQIKASHEPYFRSWPHDWKKLRAISKKVARYTVRKLRSYASGKIRWGMLKGDDIGYLQVNKLSDLIDCKDLKRLKPGYTCGSWSFQSIAVRAVMSEVMSDLKKAKGVILDLRFNAGGYDSAARIILEHFVTKAFPAYSKRTKHRRGFSPWKTFRVAPAVGARKGRLVILTSHVTASAAEVLVLSTMQMPHVTRIGERTRGVFSNMHSATMPNGWSFTLSTQQYRDSQGKNYEKVGIPPDIAISYPKGAPRRFYKAISRGLRRGDGAIAKARQFLRSHPALASR